MLRQPGFTISEWCQRPPFRRGPVLERYKEGLRNVKRASRITMTFELERLAP
jgi:hypothetical protein